jgi:hypothetical protein
MITLTNCYNIWSKEDEHGVERTQTRGVGDCIAIEERGENGFEASGVVAAEAGVDWWCCEAIELSWTPVSLLLGNLTAEKLAYLLVSGGV